MMVVSRDDGPGESGVGCVRSFLWPWMSKPKRRAVTKKMKMVVVKGQGLGVSGGCGRGALAPRESQVRKTAMLVV